jgi:serine/threonine protein kinase
MFSLPLRPGEIVGGKYEITGVVGEGAMGAVYRGRHVHFQREVAIKVLHPLLSRDRVMVRRFEREAQAAGRIGSEHIVKLLDAGTFAAGERYIVMEYLEGESLAARLDRLGTLPAAEVCAIALQLLDGLACAHDARYVHRDLKPSNVFLVGCYEGRNDFVKILDFGVSKLNAVDAGDVTQTGVLLGTPHFMAPELMRGARYADHRSDLYALGVIMFRCITGLTPFVGATAYELLHKIAYEDVPRLRTFAPMSMKALLRSSIARSSAIQTIGLPMRACSQRHCAPGAKATWRSGSCSTRQEHSPRRRGRRQDARRGSCGCSRQLRWSSQPAPWCCRCRSSGRSSDRRHHGSRARERAVQRSRAASGRQKPPSPHRPTPRRTQRRRRRRVPKRMRARKPSDNPTSRARRQLGLARLARPYHPRPPPSRRTVTLRKSATSASELYILPRSVRARLRTAVGYAVCMGTSLSSAGGVSLRTRRIIG